jgi:hypothetical protein
VARAGEILDAGLSRVVDAMEKILAAVDASGLSWQLSQRVELPGELQAQVVVGAVEGAEDLLGRTDRVLERGSVGRAGVLVQPELCAR